MLLTLIADGYPGAGRWHLPGGGTDFGEQPADGLLRELIEESGQRGRVDRAARRGAPHNPAALGPGGVPDRLARRAGDLSGGGGPSPTAPRVTDRRRLDRGRGAWFTPAEAAAVPLTRGGAATHAGPRGARLVSPDAGMDRCAEMPIRRIAKAGAGCAMV